MRRHPELGKKLQLLYSLRLNPALKSHADLAEILGISRQAVGKWARGTETSQGDAIPLSQVENVATIFGISEHWLTLEFEDFEAKIYEKLEAESRLDIKKPEKISVSLLPNTPAKIFGRKNDLRRLDSEWNERQTNILQLVGFGGMGKSSLLNAWLSRLDQKGYCGARRVYAWSFYWQAAKSEVRSSGDYFIEHALDWFGDETPADGTPWEKATRLANLIRSRRTLLLLDGMEAMQYPPGSRHGLVENPAVALLLKELASDNSGMCVVTSRLPVADLTAYEGTRVRTVELEPLSDKSSIKMLKSIGLQGSYHEYVQAVKEYTGHPLSLSLLGGYLNVVHKGRMGDFRKIRSLLDEQEMGIAAKNLMHNYLNWFQGTPERALLFAVGLFDREVSVQNIRKIAEEDTEISGLTEELSRLSNLQMSYAVDRLKQANLITVRENGTASLLDCHPLVRDFLSDFLNENHPSIWKQGHVLIFNFLKEQAIDNPNTIADIEPLFRAVIHGTQAELYEPAFELYFEKIKKRFIMLSKGSHHTDQICIHSFFDASTELPVSVLPENAKFYLISSAAANLMSLGDVDEAVEPSLRCINWFVKNSKWLEAANTAGPFLSMLIAVGKLNYALDLIEKLEDCVRNTKNSVIVANSYSFKAHALHLKGDDEDAGKLFQKSEEILTLENPGAPVSFPTISSYYCKYLLDTGRASEALERSLKTFSWRSKSSWQVAIDTTSLLASDMQILGLAYLALGDKANAKIYLNRQVELLKEADEWLYLPSGLNARASFYNATGDFESARGDLEKALEISRRTGARFGEWETLINLSHLYLQVKEPRKARNAIKELDLVGDMSIYAYRRREVEQLREDIHCAGNSNSVTPHRKALNRLKSPA
ncbi:MAG: NB-ARC domain-containing protein [Gammaproteobacteria bacterium]|nr:hypothetical protein [Pseudomonadales bacterium]